MSYTQFHDGDNNENDLNNGASTATVGNNDNNNFNNDNNSQPTKRKRVTVEELIYTPTDKSPLYRRIIKVCFN